MTSRWSRSVRRRRYLRPSGGFTAADLVAMLEDMAKGSGGVVELDAAAAQFLAAAVRSLERPALHALIEGAGLDRERLP
jgi:hypothetical protein